MGLVSQRRCHKGLQEPAGQISAWWLFALTNTRLSASPPQNNMLQTRMRMNRVAIVITVLGSRTIDLLKASAARCAIAGQPTFCQRRIARAVLEVKAINFRFHL